MSAASKALCQLYALANIYPHAYIHTHVNKQVEVIVSPFREVLSVGGAAHADECVRLADSWQQGKGWTVLTVTNALLLSAKECSERKEAACIQGTSCSSCEGEGFCVTSEDEERVYLTRLLRAPEYINYKKGPSEVRKNQAKRPLSGRYIYIGMHKHTLPRAYAPHPHPDAELFRRKRPVSAQRDCGRSLRGWAHTLPHALPPHTQTLFEVAHTSNTHRDIHP